MIILVFESYYGTNFNVKALLFDDYCGGAAIFILNIEEKKL